MFSRDVANAFGRSQPSIEWSAIIAFYGAVHYINAYVWEHLRYEPESQIERLHMLETFQDLKPLIDHYRRLWDYGTRARYIPLFTLPVAILQRLLDIDLATIEQHIHGLLAPPDDDTQPPTDASAP